MRWYSQVSFTLVLYGCPSHSMSSSSSQFLHEQTVLSWKPQVSPFPHSCISRQWYSPNALSRHAYSSGVSHCCRQQKWLIRAVVRKLSLRHPQPALCLSHLHFRVLTEGNCASYFLLISVENSFFLAASFNWLIWALPTCPPHRKTFPLGWCWAIALAALESPSCQTTSTLQPSSAACL